LVHKFGIFHQTLYILASKLPKRDRFGIHLRIEDVCLHCLELTIIATFEEKTEKLKTLKNLRIRIELLKRLIRHEYELKIINNRDYLRIETQLQELSKMANGWIKYLQPPLN
jgi:hypothetical protein